VSLSLSSCAQEQKDSTIVTPPAIEHPVKMGKFAPIVKDSLDTTIGQVAQPDSTDCSIDQGEIAYELLGDVAIAGNIGIIEEFPVDSVEKVKQFAEVMPEFIGGIDAMQKFILDNLQYPEYEKKKNIQGNVYVRFVVEKDGSLTRFEILRSVEKSINFNAEVLRVLNLMPNWNPGSNAGEKQAVYMTLPFQFRVR